MTKRHGTPAGRLAGIDRTALLVILSAFVFNFVSRGLADSFLVFMLALEEEFGWTHTSLTGVYSVYLLAVGLSAPASGSLLDRFGPRITYVGGLLLLAAALFGASFTNSLAGIYLALGLGTGMACSALGMVPAAALIGRWFDKNVSTALGFAYAGFGSGILLMVPLAQISIEALGWRETYRIAAIALVVVIPLVLLLPWRRIAAGRPLADPLPAAEPAPDAPGAPAEPAPRWTLMSAMRTRPFWQLVQVFFFTAAGMHCVIVQTVAYLVEAGYRPIDAAMAFGAAGMLSIAGVLGAGWLADNFGYRLTATLSFAGTLIGMAALVLASLSALTIFLLVYVVFFGLSQGARGPIVSALTNRRFRNGPAASIFGVIFMLMSFGSAFGASMSGMLHAWTGGYDAAFAFASLSLIIAAAPFWLPGGLGR